MYFLNPKSCIRGCGHEHGEIMTSSFPAVEYICLKAIVGNGVVAVITPSCSWSQLPIQLLGFKKYLLFPNYYFFRETLNFWPLWAEKELEGFWSEKLEEEWCFRCFPASVVILPADPERMSGLLRRCQQMTPAGNVNGGLNRAGLVCCPAQHQNWH